MDSEDLQFDSNAVEERKKKEFFFTHRSWEQEDYELLIRKK
jgi:hypothetical protein